MKRVVCMVAILAFGIAAGVWAQTQELTVEQAVTLAFENSADLLGAAWDLRSAQAQALAAKLRMIPSISLGGQYTRLSDTPAMSVDIPAYPPLTTSPFSFSIPANFGNQTDTGSLVVSLQYPVFAGFRLQEASRIAELKSTSRAYAMEIVERALLFEVRRGYWEAVRSEAAADMQAKNLAVTEALRQDVREQLSQGLATQADLMNMDRHYEEAQLAASDAAGRRSRACLALATLLGQESVESSCFEQAIQDDGAGLPSPYRLASDPAGPTAAASLPAGDLGAMVAKALTNRAETRISALSAQIAEHSVKAAQAGLYPTLSLVGDYTYSNPNSRILVSAFGLSPGFYGTWEVGLQLSYDIGAVPAAVAQARAAEADAQKAKIEGSKQADAITLDVRAAAISLQLARRNLEMVRAMVRQADENLRVQQDKQRNGLARAADVLGAQFALVQTRFAVTSREIDLQIAAADFARAAALDPLPWQE